MRYASHRYVKGPSTTSEIRRDCVKRGVCVILLILFLTGCGSGSQMNTALSLRDKVLKSSSISFNAIIAADYGDSVHTFSLECKAENNGNISFTVTDPETISGISGNIKSGKGEIIFDDTVLAFEPMLESQISPVISPWIFLYALRSGYISSCGNDGDNFKLTIDDTFNQNVFQVDIWLDAASSPQRCEILWEGRRCMSIDIRNFKIL